MIKWISNTNHYIIISRLFIKDLFNIRLGDNMSNKLVIEQLKTTKCVVAFIDILGSKLFIESDKGLDVIHKEYKRTLNDFNDKYIAYGFEMGVRIFSDNILFFIKVPQYKDPAINLKIKTLYIMKLSTSIKLFQNALLIQNILVRGGITYGDFFVDDVMVWGKALIRAYKLESEIAIYPRIVLDPDVDIDRSVFECSNMPAISHALYKDDDGLEFINFANDLKSHGISTERIKLFIEKELEINKTNVLVFKKYEWIKNYLDRTLN